ncbi:hypothetical protein PanWU01x14_079940 [Parasponia andersonii]|uniref:Uncharacterized protein n=1 Tax=Parasponia andersonii TaxID=3476 RepID=A0A2P5DBJ6_PARAD|nr:hypothetical protein PanWU01x14_079940 [Parasponia andersonii]
MDNPNPESFREQSTDSLVYGFGLSERATVQNVKENEIKNNERTTTLSKSVIQDHNVVVNRESESFSSSSIRRQKSRRTIVDGNRERRVQAQAGKDENDMMFPLTNDNNPKLVVKERECFSFESGESSTVGSEISKAETLWGSDGSDQKLKKSESYGVVSEADNIEESEDEEEEEEEEEAIENVNKAVLEWTEDDQKNLMELGLSEIERNRRLESLIAKRRARNLFRTQVEKGLMDLDGVVPCPIAPVFVWRTDPFEVPNVPNEIEGLHVPGSAPSILLPAQNPFDLPYDPLEEKPNLMADSFQQEFTAVNQKEMLFCRHESFSLGPLQFDPDHQHRRDPKFGTTERRAFEGLGYPRFKRQTGDHDRLMEQFLSEVGASKSNVGSKLESESQVLNSETSKMDLEPPVTEDSNDESTSSSSFEMANRAEVSTNIEPTQQNAEDNMFTRPIPTIVEPLYDSSPTTNDKNRMEDSLFFTDHKVARIHTPTFSIASDMQVEVSEAGSPPLAVGNVSPNDGDSLSDDVDVALSNSTNFDSKSYDDISEVMEEVENLRDTLSSNTLASENQETTIQLTEQLAAHSFFEVLSEGTEKSWSLPDDSVKEENVAYDERDSVTDIIDDMEDQDKEEDEDEDGARQILTRQAIEESLQKPAEKRDLESTLHVEGNSKNLDENQAMVFAQPAEGNLDFNVTKDSEKQTEQESVTDMSKSTKIEDSLNKTNDRKDEISSVQSEVSYVINSCSSPSSPTSTRIEPTKKEEVISSDLNQEIGINVPQSDLIPNPVKNSLLDEQPPDATSLIMPHNGEHLAENSSSSHISNTGDFESLEEPSATRRFSDEANIIINITEPAVIDDEASKEEPGTLFNLARETGSASNEDIKSEMKKLVEDFDGLQKHKSCKMVKQEPTNPPSKATEEATSVLNDPLVSEMVLDKDNFKSVEESNDELENLKHSPEPADSAKDHFKPQNVLEVNLVT